jgi:hypothetical protein
LRRYILISLAGGILFGILDGLLHANPLAQSLYAAYQPIARSSVNAAAGIGIDLAYGFILAAVFLLLYPGLPGRTGLLKGLSYAMLIWFFRAVMSALSTWMMFTVPLAALAYGMLAGLVEMLALGVLYGLSLKVHPK